MFTLPFPTVTLPVTAILVTVGAFIALRERRRPAWRRPESPAWWSRALLLNGVQLGLTALGVTLWQSGSVVPVLSFTGHGWLSVVAGYLLITLVNYWWHRARHRTPLLWRVLHRLHHSPARVEVLGAYYKHPFEMLVQGALASALLHLGLGLGVVEVSIVVLLTGLVGLFTHANIRTPRWLGWWVARPEMHRLHHARSLHHYNYSDLPLWDLLFGTFRNPHHDVPLCGFPQEQKLGRLLFGRSVKEV